MIAASLSEVAACLVRVPTEVVKTRAQTAAYGPVASSLYSAQAILAADGLMGFYRGLGITIMREIPFTSVQFPLYELFKQRLSAYLHKKPLRAHEAALCGCVAGAIAGALTTPLDVLKTRIMLDTRKADAPTRPSAFSRLLTIYHAEGAKTLFAGIVPRTIWIGAGGAVFLGMYELALSVVMRS